MTKSWTGKSRGNPLGYKIFIFLLKNTNIRFAYFLAWFVAAYFYFFSDKIAIRAFYSKLSAGKSINLKGSVFKNYFSFAKILLDRIAILAGFNSNYTFEYDGEEHLISMATSGKGGLIIGSHAGNWEVAGQLLKRINCPINIIMFDGENSAIKNLIDNLKGEKNFKIIIAKKNDLSHIYAIKEALKNGEIIALHGDRFLAGSRYHLCDFLGKEAPFSLGPYYLALKLDVPVCFVSTMKETNKHYHFYSTEPMYNRNNTSSPLTTDDLVKQMAEKYARNLEETVIKYPFQWFNYYNFWNVDNLTKQN